jgi:hypothetical protein
METRINKEGWHSVNAPLLSSPKSDILILFRRISMSRNFSMTSITDKTPNREKNRIPKELQTGKFEHIAGLV